MHLEPARWQVLGLEEEPAEASPALECHCFECAAWWPLALPRELPGSFLSCGFLLQGSWGPWRSPTGPQAQMPPAWASLQ